MAWDLMTDVSKGQRRPHQNRHYHPHQPHHHGQEEGHHRGWPQQRRHDGSQDQQQRHTHDPDAYRKEDGSRSSASLPASSALSGPVDFVHRFVNMSTVEVVNSSSGSGRTCRPAMGYAFAAGTTDGPGMFNFHQATNETTPFWEAIGDLLSTPSPDQIKCQSPKPILLDLAGIERPYQWDAEVVPIQLLRVGETFFIAAVPAEFTTMAGRRLKAAIASRIVDHAEALGIASMPLSSENITVAIAGLANSYADYVTTFEEYQGQRYEAASTIFGPYTHAAYVQLFEELVDEMASNAAPHKVGSKRRGGFTTQRSHRRAKEWQSRKGSSDDGLQPPDLYSQQVQALPDAVVYGDTTPRGVRFGDIVDDLDVAPVLVAGKDVANATFWGANPRANLKRGSTFLAVERWNEGSGEEGGEWILVTADSDFRTRFVFERVRPSGKVPLPVRSSLHHSHVTISWDIPDTYPFADGSTPHRLRYFGDATEHAAMETIAFEGISSSFVVTSL